MEKNSTNQLLWYKHTYTHVQRKNRGQISKNLVLSSAIHICLRTLLRTHTHTHDTGHHTICSDMMERKINAHNQYWKVVSFHRIGKIRENAHKLKCESCTLSMCMYMMKKTTYTFHFVNIFSIFHHHHIRSWNHIEKFLLDVCVCVCVGKEMD